MIYLFLLREFAIMFWRVMRGDSFGVVENVKGDRILMTGCRERVEASIELVRARNEIW